MIGGHRRSNINARNANRVYPRYIFELNIRTMRVSKIHPRRTSNTSEEPPVTPEEEPTTAPLPDNDTGGQQP
jgi:hypothetical protein